MHIFFSVGEPSGDQHGAALMQHYRRHDPTARFTGFGGPEMQEAGLECLFQLTDLAVMGVGQVLPLLAKFRSLVLRAEEFLKHEKPDAVVLIDFPGFNWWIAAAAKKAGIPVYYFCPPQLWAWAQWRIRKVKRYVDCVLSVLEFEADWYRSHGIDVEYVGHPFFDEVAQHPVSEEEISMLRQPGHLTLGLLPGSRRNEVMMNFPVMLNIIEELYEKHPNIHCPVACYKQWHLEKCGELLDQHGGHLPIELRVDRTAAIIEASDFCLMVSGSVSLEMLARKTPAVVMYRGSRLTYLMAHTLMTVKYFSLPNLMVNRPMMPEYPFVRPNSSMVRRMVAKLDSWLSDRSQIASVQQEVADLADEIVEVGGLAKAAAVLHTRLTRRPHTLIMNRAA